MIENKINDDRTVVGGGKGMILAGRYHILRQLRLIYLAFPIRDALRHELSWTNCAARLRRKRNSIAFRSRTWQRLRPKRRLSAQSQRPPNRKRFRSSGGIVCPLSKLVAHLPSKLRDAFRF